MDDVNTLDCYTEYTFLFLDDDLIILIPWAIVTSLHHLHHCAEPLVYFYFPNPDGSNQQKFCKQTVKKAGLTL